jgi:hypothetical protein
MRMDHQSELLAVLTGLGFEQSVYETLSAFGLDVLSIAHADESDWDDFGIDHTLGKMLQRAMAQHLSSEPEPEPKPDERTLQLQDLTELGVQQWSAAQVLEWVALADLPSESVGMLTAAFESMDLDDGEELLGLRATTLQKKLTKQGAQNANELALRLLQQRDALLCSTPPESDLTEQADADDQIQMINVLMLKERDANTKLIQNRKQALKARNDGFRIPVRRVGDIDCETRAVRLSASVPVEGPLGRSALQDLIVSDWHPIKVIVTDDGPSEVANMDDAMLRRIEEAYPGMEVASYILKVWQELQLFNPSGGYTVEIPWNNHENRELTPAEVTEILMRGKGKKKTNKRGGRS